jgi:hypothetical protein
MVRNVRLATQTRYTQICIDRFRQRQENRFTLRKLSSRHPSGRHNMRSTGGIALVFCFTLLGTSAGWTQPAPEKSIQCDSAAKSKPTNPSLLGRSEMQEPKPLPAIRALRFQQIPVAVCPEDSRFEDMIVIGVDSISAKSGDQQPERMTPPKSAPDVQAPAGQ